MIFFSSQYSHGAVVNHNITPISTLVTQYFLLLCESDVMTVERCLSLLKLPQASLWRITCHLFRNSRTMNLRLVS